MKFSRILSVLLCLILAATAGCVISTEVPAEITEISGFGNAVLNIKPETLTDAGISFGDMVSVSINGHTLDMPYLDGFYVRTGDLILRGKTGIKVELAVNYGNFSEDFDVQAGDTLTIKLKEKDGAKFMQNIGGEQYSLNREDFSSDEVFANFRMIRTGNIAENTFYRSASPINNESKRAGISNSLAEEAEINAVLNLADTKEHILSYASLDDFSSEYYLMLFESGRVLPAPVSSDMDSPEFAKSVTEGLIFLSEHEPPYLIHCREGKDRAGLTSALVEALMGASEEEIVSDYMISYENYYGLTKADESEYNYIAENIRVFLRHIAGLDDEASLDGVNLEKAAEEYLLENGMAKEKLTTLKDKLAGIKIRV